MVIGGTMPLTNEELLQLKAQQLSDLEKYLPYADGQAYYQDLREIERLKEEIRDLTKQEEV
jgi:hypothetical protein